MNREQIRLRVEIGRLVDDVLCDRHRYGEDAVELLADALGWSVSDLHWCRTVFVAYPERQLARLLKRPMVNGHVLSFTHLAWLSLVKGAVNRRALCERVFAESIPASVLADEVLAMIPLDRTRKNRRY